MNAPVSRRRFLTGAPAVAVAAVLGHRDHPKVSEDHRAVLAEFVESGARGTMDGAVGPSHSAVHLATAAALLDLSPKEEP